MSSSYHHRSAKRSARQIAGTPAALYAMTDFPAPNVEMALYPTRGGSGLAPIVVTPVAVLPSQVALTNEETGAVSFVNRFKVTGLSDGGYRVDFTAQTVPHMPDEIRLHSDVHVTHERQTLQQVNEHASLLGLELDYDYED